jgi:hypothetical protein
VHRFSGKNGHSRKAVILANRDRPWILAKEERLTHAQLRTPRAAAVAGILFSVLLFMTFGLVRISVPGDPFEPGAWLENGLLYVTLAMHLVPFAGVAFLWFMGVLRDRLGEREDQFFATVFLGSGLLLLARLFSAAAVVVAIIIAFMPAMKRSSIPLPFISAAGWPTAW